jgi:parallel beta helix pectate lyase-like protein
MRTVHFFAVVLFALAFASVAQAQATRTWVSGVGDDVNPCSRTAPCKTFAGAISKTAVGGEIDALDPAGYGAVTITKSITIDGSGTMGSILASQVNGIIINIAPTDANKTVRIRGLSINGAGTGINGIRMLAAAKVSIENTVIDGFTANGISVEAAGAQVFVRNTTIRNNASGINNASGAEVVMSGDSVVHNGTGLIAPKGGIVSFKNNVIYGNKKDGDAPSAMDLR